MKVFDYIKQNIFNKKNNLLTDKQKFEYLKTLTNDFDRIEVIKTFSTDELRLEGMKELTKDKYRVEVLKIIIDEKLRLSGLEELIYDDYKVEVIKTFSTDELRLEGMKELTEDKYRVEVLKIIIDEKLRLSGLDELMFDDYKVEVIKTFSTDELKLEGLKELMFEWNKVSIIISLSIDELKLEGLKELTKEEFKVEVIKSFFYDKLKIDFLKKIEKEENKIKIIKSIRSTKEILEQLTLISNFELVVEAINNIELVDDISIPNDLINKYSEYYRIPKDRLNLLVKKFGYRLLCSLENDNIKKIFFLCDEHFEKYMAIFDRKNIDLDMNTINDVANLLFQRLFRKKFSETCSIFPTLRQLIEINDKENIRLILDEINQYVTVKEYLQNDIDIDIFIDRLLEKKDINILHDITNKYIMIRRNDYAREKLKNIDENLNFDYKYEKSYIVKRVIKVNSIYNLIGLIKTIDTSLLNEEELKLINNKALLTEIIKFKKSPTEYGDNSSIRNYFKAFDKLFSILYENDKLVDITNDPQAKKILVPKKVSSEYLLSIMSEINVDKVVDKLFTDDESYNDLLEVLNKYKLLGSGSTYDRLLDKTSIILDNTTLASLIENFYRFYPELKNNLKKDKTSGENVKVPLSIILDNANVYGSDSYKYSLLFGYKNYKLLSTDPAPNRSSATKEERLTLAIQYVIAMYERKYVTVPPIDSDIEVIDKKINVVVGNTTNMINLTYGERTDSCMRIEGFGNTLFDCCLRNKNGFHIRFCDPDTGEFISRVSGIRNGNTIFLNQLRDSNLRKYDNDYLVEACYEVARMLIDTTKNSEYPIDNIVISPEYAMEEYSFEKQNLGIFDVKEGFDKKLYLDVNNCAIVLATSDPDKRFVPVRLGTNEVTHYQPQRDKIKECNDEIEIIESIARIQMIDQLLEGISFEDCSYNVEKNICKCYVGEDFYLTVDNKGNMNYYIMKNSINKENAMKEIKNIINEIGMSLTIFEEVEEEYVSKKRN